MRVAFQPAEPMAVQSVNLMGLSRSMPAGMEIRERIPGMKRPKKTEAGPYLSNQYKAPSTSLASTSHIQSAILRKRSAPIHAPMPYSAQAPRMEPAVAQIKVGQKPRLPCEIVNPASGSTTSEGIGGKRFSNKIAMPTRSEEHTSELQSRGQ